MEDHKGHKRSDYSRSSLNDSELPPIPMVAFQEWLAMATISDEQGALAAVLSTVYLNKPSSRIVLLRGVAEEGLKFFSNYESRKAIELEANDAAALNFFWPHLEKQVRIEGKVAKLPKEESDAYFDSRPRESQIGAWTSPQSKTLSSREELEKAFEENKKKFQGYQVKRPPNWGGYILKPNYFEFWQGRVGRLHDRICYLKDDNEWQMTRLAP